MPLPALLRFLTVSPGGFRAVSLPRFTPGVVVVWVDDERYG
jgi:hypothetical protein